MTIPATPEARQREQPHQGQLCRLGRVDEECGARIGEDVASVVRKCGEQQDRAAVAGRRDRDQGSRWPAFRRRIHRRPHRGEARLQRTPEQAARLGPCRRFFAVRHVPTIPRAWVSDYICDTIL